MSYIGRACFSGMTSEGYPFVSYVISGRSAGSQKRRFKLYFDLNTGEDRVNVGSLGEPTEDQKKRADLIFYNCMRTRNGTIFVTNGAQTDVNVFENRPARNFYSGFGAATAEEILGDWGYEPDAPLFTPRIALVKGEGRDALFAIAARQSDDDDRTYTGQITVPVNGSEATGIATYKGLHESEAQPWRGVDLEHLNLCLVRFPIRGVDPEEIRDSTYKAIDPRYVVAAAAAVYDGRKWVFAEPKNKWDSLEEFEAGEAKKWPV
ncbi:MAG TPA: IMP cyclohydrolase [archaeon]|nr:IMP cyclohydrolase [archaeon]